MKGVVYRDTHDRPWQHLLQLQPQVRDYVAILGLQVVIDEAEGYAFLRQRPADEDDDDKQLPRLIPRRSLSFPVSLLLALLRKKLAEFDAQGGDTRLMLTRAQLTEMLRVFLPATSNEARITRPDRRAHRQGRRVRFPAPGEERRADLRSPAHTQGVRGRPVARRLRREAGRVRGPAIGQAASGEETAMTAEGFSRLPAGPSGAVQLGHVRRAGLVARARTGRMRCVTGDIGSGKSTIVDALTTLLLPANRISYNKAAGAETKERSLRSYVLGYYKSERDETTGTTRAGGAA